MLEKLIEKWRNLSKTGKIIVVIVVLGTIGQLILPKAPKQPAQQTQQTQQAQKQQKAPTQQEQQKEPVTKKQAPNYKSIFKQDLPRVTGAECIIDASTLEMNRMGDGFVIFHCTALIGGSSSQIEALYYAEDGKLIQMKRDNEVIFHEQ